MKRSVLCRIMTLLLILSVTVFMSSCARKEDAPTADPVPSGTSVPDDTGNAGGGSKEGSTSEEDIGEKLTGLKAILRSLDEKIKSGISSDPEKLEVPGKRSMMIPLESMQFVSRPFDENTHHGIDLVAQDGTGVYAAFSGFVADVGSDEEFGNCVLIEHGGGIMTLYTHLQSREAETGSYVEMGDVIGYVGSTGSATGPHLDFRVLDNGTEVDPEPFLNAQIQK